MHYELLQMSKQIVHGEVYRIRATQDIPEQGVTKGQLGGYMCPDSVLTDGAWINDGDNFVWNSELKGNVLVTDHAQVVNCQLSGTCYIGYRAKLSKVSGSGLFAEGFAEMINCHVHSRNNDKARLQVFGEVVIHNTQFTCKGKGDEAMIIQDSAKVENSDISGKVIRIKGDTRIQSTVISANIVGLWDVKLMRHTTINGTEIHFNDVESVSDTKVDAPYFKVDGCKLIESCDIHKASAVIQGVGIVMKDVLVNGGALSVRDSAYLEHVYTEGKNNKVADFASLIGRKKNSIQLLGDVRIGELVKIHTEDGRNSTLHVNETIFGDIVIKGE